MRAPRRTTILLAMLLLASLGANYLLFGRVRQFYTELSETRLDPLGFAMGDTTAVPPRGRERARVALVGDSRAFLWRRPPLPPEYMVINRGVGGHTTVQVLARFDSLVAPLDPDLIVLEAGMNDLKVIALVPERREEIIETCRRNMRALVERSLATGADVVLVTIFPRGPLTLDRRPFWSTAVDSAVIDVNRSLKALAGERVSILDASFLLDDEGYVRDDYAEDLFHVNDAGYVALNRRLMEILESDNRIEGLDTTRR